MGEKGTTVAIREVAGAPPRKITKVVGSGTQGFGVVMPYHQARSGFLAKMPIDYGQVGTLSIRLNECLGFTAEHRVKLSYHADGFAQFSGEVQGQIISGRDPVTGEPKGLGLMARPLSDPIRTGPSFGVEAWGLNDFDELRDVTQGAVVFEPEDVYFRRCTPRTANGWVFEVFVFPKRYWAAARKRGAAYSISMSFLGFEASGAVIEMKVLDLPQQEVLLAGFLSRVTVSFASPSGWVLDGPGDPNGAGRGHVLMAFYPRDVFVMQQDRSLDR